MTPQVNIGPNGAAYNGDYHLVHGETLDALVGRDQVGTYYVKARKGNGTHIPGWSRRVLRWEPKGCPALAWHDPAWVFGKGDVFICKSSITELFGVRPKEKGQKLTVYYRKKGGR